MTISERLRAQAKSQTRREEGEDWRDNYQWQAADVIDALVAALDDARKFIDVYSGGAKIDKIKHNADAALSLAKAHR